MRVTGTGIVALKRAIKLHKWTQEDVATAVGVKQPSVNHILKKGLRVPAEWCLPLERFSGGDLTRHQLRSDLYPLDDKSKDESSSNGAAA